MLPLRMASSLHHIEQSMYSLFFLIVVHLFSVANRGTQTDYFTAAIFKS